MDLLELKDKTLDLFETNIDGLGEVLLASLSDHDKLSAFCELIEDDLSVDWLQMIYQYYSADRKGAKQDFTPKSLACFMGMLAGETDQIVDMCAGSGALIIQKWIQNPDTQFTAIELDENVIPFLLFNMVLRNISCRVYKMDALTGDEPEQIWNIRKGERFGIITNIEPAL